jgi:hypothetical protein
METAQRSLPMPFKPTLNFTNVTHQINNLRIHIRFLYAEDAINDYTIQITVSSSRLSQHLIVNNILATEQYGFQKNRSTEHADYTLVNGILQAWNSKLQVAEFSVTSLRLLTM